MVQNEPGDVLWHELMQTERSAAKTFREKCPGYGKVIGYCRLGEATFLDEIPGETPFDSMKGAALDPSTGDDGTIPQMSEEIP
jgi:hypothetical protein